MPVVTKKGVKTALKYVCLAFILSFLFIPHLQSRFQINSLEKPLKGVFRNTNSDTDFTWSTWFSDSFQVHKAAYLNETFGMRPSCVRLNNQLDFLLFKKGNLVDFAVGKENYLYQLEYIDAYNGKGYKGRQEVKENVAQLKLLQDELKKMGKNLLFVMAPSKARLYPEYLPADRVTGPTEECYYTQYYNELTNNGVNFIDINKWLERKKVTAKYPVYPQLGVHYSRLEAVNTADTILKYFSFLSGKKLPQIKIHSLIEKDTLEPPDDDAVIAMNLLCIPELKKMAYPQYEIVGADKGEQSLLVIADSYWRDIYEREIPLHAFKNNEYWYYFKEVQGNNHYSKTTIDKIDVKRHLLQYNNILIMCTESKLGNFSFGFVKAALEELKKEISPTDEEVKAYVNRIRRDADWLRYVEKKAKDQNVSVDEVLQADAKYMFTINGPCYEDPTIGEIRSAILNDPKWLKSMDEKAAMRKISVDSMVTIDAIYVINERKRVRGY